MRHRVSRNTTPVVTAFLITLAVTAQAAPFDITIKNTTTAAWSAGLLSLTPLISLGLVPQPGTQAYATYTFVSNSCNTADAFCGTGCVDDGNATVLAQRWGLTINTNAWLFPALAAGASATVTIDAPVGSRLSYVSRDATAADDAIFMFQTGSPGTLSVPLFSGTTPLSTVAFSLGGYDINSTSATDGNAATCTRTCPPPTTACYVAAGNGGATATIPGQPVATATFHKVWEYTETGFTTDGLALGDVGGSTAANELVVLLEGAQSAGTYDPTARGRLLTLDTSGALSTRFSAAAGHDLMGIPLIENVNSAGKLDTLAGEFLPATPLPGGGVYAASGATPIWTSTGYGYPGFWNMGPSSIGTVRPDVVAMKIVVPTWGGDIAVLKAGGPTVSTLNTVSLFSTAGETLYGHVALANFPGLGTTGSTKIVAYGATTGKIYLLQPNTVGTGMTVLWSSTPVAGMYAFGSGPAVGDLDGDGKPEIVVSTAGTGKVYAYDPTSSVSGACKYSWTAPGGFDYAWSSPVIGNVNGSLTGTIAKEVVVMSSNAVLSVLSIPTAGTGCRAGSVTWTHTVGNGGAAWFTPALANLTGTANLDVVVASYTTLEVIDVAAKTVAFSYTDPTATFYPSAVIERLAGGSGPGAAIYASGWSNSKVYRFDSANGSTVPAASWSTFMGDNTRTGSR